jgi:ABC-2 type transport system ATP-binding protein
VWEYIRSLSGSMTIFLTTHYLEEAEQLCDRIAIMDHGRLIALGSTQELKDRLSGATIYEIEFSGQGANHYAPLLKSMPCVLNINQIESKVIVSLECWECLSEIVTALNGAPVRRISLQENTLEDVFISLTGEKVRE